MPSDLLGKFLFCYDPIHDGFTPSGIANGVTITNGFSFPRIRGGYNIYRGSPTKNDIDWSNPMGAAAADATAIKNFAWRPHAPGTVYFYGLRAIGGGGVEETGTANIRRVEFDTEGGLIGPRPNAPGNLQVRPRAGGTFELRWTYSPDDEETAPASFNIYHDNGSGTMNYDTPISVVQYRVGRLHYLHISETFGDQTKVQWAVRAVSTESVEEDNDTVMLAQAEAEGPPVHPTVKAEPGPDV